MTTTTTLLQRAIFTYFGVISLYAFADKLFGAVYIAAMSSNGLSNTQIGFVLMIGSLFKTVLDYPSGNVADTFGRKKTTAVGFLIWGTALAAFALAEGLLAYSTAMLLWALGVALISGVPESWFVDELKRIGEGAKRLTLMPTARTISLVIGALSGLITSVIGSFGFKWPLVLGGGVAILTGVLVILCMTENYGERGISLMRVISHNTVDILSSQRYRRVLLLAASGRVPFQVFVMSWQLYALQHLGLPATYFGPILTLLILTLGGRKCPEHGTESAAPSNACVHYRVQWCADQSADFHHPTECLAFSGRCGPVRAFPWHASGGFVSLAARHGFL